MQPDSLLSAHPQTIRRLTFQNVAIAACLSAAYACCRDTKSGNDMKRNGLTRPPVTKWQRYNVILSKQRAVIQEIIHGTICAV